MKQILLILIFTVMLSGCASMLQNHPVVEKGCKYGPVVVAALEGASTELQSTDPVKAIELKRLAQEIKAFQFLCGTNTLAL